MRLTERLRSALVNPDGTIRGYTAPAGDMVFTNAAVLVPITDRAEPGVLLTLRRADLRRHAGQVAFPGGRIDPGDRDAIAAALREAEEEIGLDPALVEVVGTIDRYRTGTGFEIMPVVGVVPPDLPLVPHEAEVAAIFEVPLTFLLDRANHIPRSLEWNGAVRPYHEIVWGEWRIWGVTAAMIMTLAERLRCLA